MARNLTSASKRHRELNPRVNLTFVRKEPDWLPRGSLSPRILLIHTSTMDPGLGLIVSSIVPSEVEVPKLPPKSPLKLPNGFLEKTHVRHALKYMADDGKREEALKVAMAWKEKFAAAKWKPVLAAIEATSNEDSIRLSPLETNLHDFDAAVHRTERPRALTTASAPVVPQAISQSTPARAQVVRLHTSLPLRCNQAPATPRTIRWDVITSDPVTPLSPMPIDNSFSRHGYWGKSTPQDERDEISTPATAICLRPASPIVPKNAYAREIYERVNTDVENLARKYSLARNNVLSSARDDSTIATTFRPKDIREAARVVLGSRKVELKTTIATDLPERLRNHALDEAALRNRLCINNEQELSEQNDWMNDETLMPFPPLCVGPGEHTDYAPPPFGLAVSILDEQREALRVFCTQRKAGDLDLDDMALDAAWAVRILEDAERAMAFDADGTSSHGESNDNDDGYSYGNILLSIKSEMSTSTSSGALSSMVDELSNTDLSSLRSRANTHSTVDSTRSREFRFPQRSSTSPAKGNLQSTRFGESAVSSSSHKHNASLRRRQDLRIATTTFKEVPSGGLSPEDREFRRRGPQLADLNYWAEELKRMEAMRAHRELPSTFHRRSPIYNSRPSDSPYQRSSPECMSIHSTMTRVSTPGQLSSRFSSSSSSSSTLKPLSFTRHSSPTSLSAPRDSKPTMLDHEYHQLKMRKSPINADHLDTSTASTHDPLHRSQHLRSTSSLKVLVNGSTKESEDEWMNELNRMESRERSRQRQERRRT